MLVGQTGPEAALYSAVRHTLQHLFGDEVSHGVVGDRLIRDLDTLALVDRLLRLLEVRRIRLLQPLSWEIAEALALADYFEIQHGCRGNGDNREFRLSEVEDGMFLKRLFEVERFTYAFSNNADINATEEDMATVNGARFPNTPEGRAQAAAFRRQLAEAGRAPSQQQPERAYRTMNDALNAARRLSEIVDESTGRVIGYDRTPEELHELAQSLYEGKGMTRLPERTSETGAGQPSPAASTRKKPSLLGALGRGVVDTLLPRSMRDAAASAGARAAGGGERGDSVRVPYQDELEEEEVIDSLPRELRDAFDMYLDDPLEEAIAALREEQATDEEIAAFSAYWRRNRR